MRDDDEHIVREMPELAIVSRELCDTVQPKRGRGIG